MNSTPAVAVAKHESTITRYKKKLDLFEEMISGSRLEEFPGSFTVENFAVWHKPDSDIFKLSRSVVYSNKEEYLSLKEQLKGLFARAEQSKIKSGKRKNIVSDLETRLAAAENIAADYKNQWAMLVTELDGAKKEIARLNLALQRSVKNGRASTALFPVK